MNQNTQHNPVDSTRRAAHRHGFSLVEVLIAMGIFAVGFVAVAAMFPAGAILQKETVAQVESQLVGRNAAAIVRSARLTFASDASFAPDLLPNSCEINLAPFSLANFNNTKVKDRWKIGDRSYPTAQETIVDRKYFWVPFIRRTKAEAKDKADWSVVVFVLRRDASYEYDFDGTPDPVPSGTWANSADGNTVPKVIGVSATVTAPNRFNFNNRIFPQTGAGLPDQVRPGDFVADNNGVVYNVIDADSGGCTIVGGILPTPSGGTTQLWYAAPPGPGAGSPCVRILLLSGLVSDADAP